LLLHDVWLCFREKRELDRLQEQSRAAERERRSSAWLKSSHTADVHGDARKMPTDQQQQQQQQEQRRERERALIVDKATAGCVADAVNQHFQESLKHVEQKVSESTGIHGGSSTPTLMVVFIICSVSTDSIDALVDEIAQIPSPFPRIMSAHRAVLNSVSVVLSPGTIVSFRKQQTTG